MARWGLIPFWMKEKPKVPHINARAETVHKLPLFREAFAKRRCLIPATGFYEWQQRDDGKQPYRFRRKDLEPFAFAGIWEFARKTRLALTPQRGRVPRMRVPKESPDEKSLRGQGWENLNAGVRSQPYKITMSRRSLLWHAKLAAREMRAPTEAAAPQT